MLRLHYGNDKRNPIRTLDLAESAGGHIFLRTGGFAPGAGEMTQLWTDQSIRHDGQVLLAESMANSELSVTYDLSSTSQAGLGYLQRKVNRFFMEVKQHNAKYKQGHKVWLEYRWPDGLNTLPTPTFGQLSGFYQVYAAKSPRWPNNLHTGALLTGNIEEVVIDLTCSPAPKGLKQKAANATGTITHHAKGVLIASGASTQFRYTSYTGSGLTANFVITGWGTLNATWSSGTKDIFDYYVDANNRIRIQYDVGNTRWTITKIVGGVTFTANSSSDVVANGDDVHLVLVQDSTTLRLYVNGAAAASIAATATMTDGGTIALACAATGATDGVDLIMDGWRIMNDDISATLADAIYDAELPIKTDGGQVGPPLYWWTKDGDGQVDNVNDTSRDNYGIIGGVGGDLEAELEIQMNHSVTGRFVTWIGLKANDELVTASDYYYFESVGGASTADAGSSNGTYSGGTGTSFTLESTPRAVDPELLFNRYRVIARLYASATVTAQFLYGLSGVASNHVFSGKAISYAGASVLELVDLGDLFLRHDSDGFGLSNQEVDYKISLSAAGSFTGQFDFAQLLPWPYARIEAAIDSRPIIAEEGMAYPVASVGTYGPTGYAQYRGPAIRAVPNCYNYLFVMITNTDDTFDITHTSDVTIYATPRYLLPGGMVA